MCPEPDGPRIRPLAERDVPDLDPAVHFLAGAKATGLGDALDVVFPATSEVLCRLKLACDSPFAPRRFDDELDRALAEAARPGEDGRGVEVSMAVVDCGVGTRHEVAVDGVAHSDGVV